MKKFLEDKTLFTLLLVHVFLGIVVIIYALLKIDASRFTTIISYRPRLGLASAFIQGSKVDLYSFPLMAFLIAFASIILSYRARVIKREYSVYIFVLGLILALFNARVMYAVYGIR